jgi:hypothetical protein
VAAVMVVVVVGEVAVVADGGMLAAEVEAVVVVEAAAVGVVEVVARLTSSWARPPFCHRSTVSAHPPPPLLSPTVSIQYPTPPRCLRSSPCRC